MGEVRDLNIKNRTYYYFNDIIDMKKFMPNLLKVDKKSHRDFDIYYIGCDTIKKFSDCKNIHSVNPLYLLIYSATGYFKEEYGEKYLILDPIEKYEEVFLKLNQKFKPSMMEENYFMKKIMLELGLILTIMYH